MSFLSSLSGGAKAAIYVVLVLLICGAVVAFYPQIWWIMLLGLLVIGLLLLTFKLLLTLRDRKRGKDTNAKVLSAAQGGAGVTDAADQAALDDLQKKFSRGVDTLDSLGLDLYALPWFVIVGQPASGKTEAIRRCKIPFPPGLTDELQGTGGTVNMDWWFTNDAVILDTAGKMLFQEAGQGTSEEWIRFLKLVRDARPHCPINGMLLVIPADSLIGDSPEQIDQNAKTIAAQLNLIQRTLGVRFPVFVLITKCDLITGFREFFDTLDDRQHQQMLGWSNPDPLDTPFDPQKVQAHLAMVRGRLEKMRFTLIQDPISSAGSQGRRLDDVDRLYDYPAAMEDISQPLQRYLEIIFTGSKLAPKPLFLRGIYFTSSIQKGSILDGVLAQAMGVSLDSVTETKPFERVRPLFLRDLFMEKIFAEGGLVTRADNTVKLKARRRAMVLGTTGIGVMLLILLSWLGFRTFQNSIGDQGEVWSDVAASMTDKNVASLILETPPGSGKFVYNGNRPPSGSDKKTPADVLPAKTRELVDQQIDVPFIFRLTAGLSGNLLSDERGEAHAKVISDAIVRPLVKAAAVRLEESDDPTDPQAAAAIAQLVRLRTLKAGLSPSGPPARLSDKTSATDSALDLYALLSYVVNSASNKDQADALEERGEEIEQLQRILDKSINDLDKRKTLAKRVLDDTISDKELTKLVNGYLESRMPTAGSSSSPVQQIDRLAVALRGLDKAKNELIRINESRIKRDEPDSVLRDWGYWTTESSQDDTGFIRLSEEVSDILKALKKNGIVFSGRSGESVADAVKQATNQEAEAIEEGLSDLRDQLAASKDLPKDDDEADNFPIKADRLITRQVSSHTDKINRLLNNSEGAGATKSELLMKLIPVYITQTREMERLPDTMPKLPHTLLEAMCKKSLDVEAELPESTALSDITASIAGIDKEVESLKGEITEFAKPLKASKDFELLRDSCILVLELRAKHARTRLLKHAASNSENKDDIAKRVAKLSEQDTSDKWDAPTIPLSIGFDSRPEALNAQTFQLNPRFHPGGLERYLGDWKKITDGLGNDPKELGKRFTEPEAVSKALGEIKDGLDPYLKLYTDYWSEDVILQANFKTFHNPKGKPADNWEKFYNAISLVDIDDVKGGLKDLATQVDDALKIAEAALDEKKQAGLKAERDTLVDRLRGEAKAREKMIEQAENLLARWGDIKDPKDEVEAIRKMKIKDFSDIYLKGIYTGIDKDKPGAFWSDMTVDALNLIADLGKSGYDEAQKKLENDDQLRRFPLFNRNERGKPLSVEELGDALEDQIKTLAGGTKESAYEEKTIGRGEELPRVFDDINTILERLRGWSELNEDKQKDIERLVMIAKSLTYNKGPKVKIYLPDEKTVEKYRPSWAKQKANGKFVIQRASMRYWGLKINGNDALRTEKKYDADSKSFLEIQMPKGDLKIQFERQSQQPDKKPVIVGVVADDGKDWSAVRLILPKTNLSDIKFDDGIYWVPLKLENERNSNDTYYHVIGLKFEQPLPAPTDWPVR